MSLFEQILKSRNISDLTKDSFIYPKYDNQHDPFLLPDMEAAVDRLVAAQKANEHVVIYGDYDIDGLTATTILLDAFKSFKFKYIDTYIPNRFIEGYGLTIDAIERIASTGASLVITVDCGSLSTNEIKRANELNMDVIVTDHHNVLKVQPSAIAVINPKRLLQDHPNEYENFLLKKTSQMKLYPFLDLAGCGVAFKLVQALQTKLNGLEKGQEKWLLDLVALGTVCDIVTLIDENRTNVYWGLKVLSKTRRAGLRALMAVAKIDPAHINARSLGFGLGPRMNAAGRLETAKISLDMLTAIDNNTALEKAYELDNLNSIRKSDQDVIYRAAVEQANLYKNDPVIVVSSPEWNHGIVGIVAAKLLEKYAKPVFVLQELDDQAKGSARSYGDFSAADAIRFSDEIITKGGGHKFAAGVTLPVKNISLFRESVNNYYHSLKLIHDTQKTLLLPKEDVSADINDINEQLVQEIALLEPFGKGNAEPIIRTDGVTIVSQRTMGVNDQHLKINVLSSGGSSIQLLAFNAPEKYFLYQGQRVSIWYQPSINEWRGNRTIEGVLRHIELHDIAIS